MRGRVAAARAGHLATTRPDGAPHVVPFVFALDGDTIYSSVDDKPKTTLRPQRVRNIEHDARASVLVDHYDEDWSALWWVRADGRARVVTDDDERARALDALAAKYERYRVSPPPGPVIAIDVERWSGWAAADV